VYLNYKSLKILCYGIIFRNNSYSLERQELMRPSTSMVKKTEMSTTGWLDSDDDDYNDDKQPLLNEKALKQQQQYLLKGKNQRVLRF